jgi:transcriptional regulator with XRE-family HTH domain
VRKKNLVGANIREVRKTSKPPVTQLDLVARLGLQGLKIDQSALSKIENGQRPVSDLEVSAFAKALKVPVSQLYGEKSGRTKPD